jgi:hypothetical protein
MVRRLMVLACIFAGLLLLATGCNTAMFAEPKDDSPRVYFESNPGELVESPYTIQGLASALDVEYGYVQRQGNEWIRFGKQWEATFRVIGLDRVLLEEVGDYRLREQIEQADGGQRERLEQERVAGFARWMIPEHFIDRVYSEEPEWRHIDAINRLNGKPTHP